MLWVLVHCVLISATLAAGLSLSFSLSLILVSSRRPAGWQAARTGINMGNLDHRPVCYLESHTLFTLACVNIPASGNDKK